MATDIDISHYNTGTATVAANGTAVTGQGTTWQGAVRPGDMFGTHKGDGIRILSVNSNTSLTLAYPWTGGAQTAAPYEIQRTPYDLGYQKAVEDFLTALQNGNLPAFAALPGAANKLPYFNGANSMAMTDLTALGRSLLASASPAALWSAAGLSDGYVARSGNQTVGGRKTFEIAPVVTTSDRLILPPLASDVPQLSLAYTLGGNVGFYNLTDGRWHLIIASSGPNGDGIIPPAHLGHIAGAATDGFARLTNELAGNGETGGSLRLYGNGTFGYVFDGVNNLECSYDTGNLTVRGSLTAASKSFLIDHPLDPFNKDLVFAATESPGLFVEFTGRATLVDGRAVVDIDATSGMTPGTWDALATDNLIKALVNESSFARLRPGPVLDGKFEIICEDETSADTVVWTVIGRRRDAFVMDPENPMTDGAGRLIVEPEKPEYDPEIEDEVDAY